MTEQNLNVNDFYTKKECLESPIEDKIRILMDTVGFEVAVASDGQNHSKDGNFLKVLEQYYCSGQWQYTQEEKR